jgi:HAD superfamily hydrolase (TIGR01549 family)
VRLQAVVFDVGETLFSEERAWNAWADWLGVRRGVFYAALGALIAERRDHVEVFDRFGRGRELEEAARAAAGIPAHEALFEPYPDAAASLARVREAGLRVGVAGNQPVAVEAMLEPLRQPGEVVATSEGWGVSKPAPGFFTRLVGAMGLPPEAIAYVGDRVDNDIVPAASAGMVAVHVRQGPWGVVQAEWPEAAQAIIRAENLTEAADALLVGGRQTGSRPR